MKESREQEYIENPIRIGKFGKPHGLTGEIRVYSMSDVPDRFKILKEVWLEKEDGKVKRLKVVGIRPGERFFLMRFESYDTPEKSRELSNGYLVIPKEMRPRLPKGRYYVDDLIGLTAEDSQGKCVGKIASVLHPGPHDIFEIKGQGEEVLIPVIEESIIDIDIQAGKIVIKMPEYL